MSREFHVLIDARLVADELDDAFIKLGEYYLDLGEAEDANSVASPFLAESKASIHPSVVCDFEDHP